MLAQNTSPDVTATHWIDVCPIDDLIPGTGAAALIDGHQVALFRSRDGEAVYALSNFDPFSRAFVLARGILGCRNGAPKVASPIFKHNFDLRSGACLDDPAVRLLTYPVRVAAGRVAVGSHVAASHQATEVIASTAVDPAVSGG
jgi:nitrite reductase (NADH) small subunit